MHGSTDDVRAMNTTWPHRSCPLSLVASRPEWLEGRDSAWDTGFGGRVTSMVVTAAHALTKGFGFEPSPEVCALEERARPRGGCFFLPPEGGDCGPRVEKLCFDANRLCDSAPSGTKKKAVYHGATLRIAPANVSAACRLLTGQDGRNCVDQVLAWRTISRVVLRLQPSVAARVHDLLAWSHESLSGTYGALHIRRTDLTKVHAWGRRASAVHPCKYVARLRAMAGRSAKGLSVFVAYDDPQSIDELRSCPDVQSLRWSLVTFPGGAPGREFLHDASVPLRLWAEMTLLAQATWLVATLSSNVGRLVQLMRQQSPDTLSSMDDFLSGDANRYARRVFRPDAFMGYSCTPRHKGPNRTCEQTGLAHFGNWSDGRT
tara:strand:+ start:122 stop:1243 length:1122 start_codon:yes stop_codon:yes gene_type:complete